MNNKIIEVGGIECYENDNVVYLKLETCARGLGFTEKAASGNETIRWRTVRHHLRNYGIATGCDEQLPEFIPENIFYRLAMKAKNEIAEAFQAKVADEIIPEIRRTGTYGLIPKDFASALRAYADEVEKNEKLTAENAILKPKAGYFDALVERNTNINFRDTAKEFNMGQKEFINFLLESKFVYRDAKGQLKPYIHHVDNELFVIKEGVAKHNNWSGNQTLITPKGRETFRLILGK